MSGTFAVTTADKFTRLPFEKAKSFRINNLTGKVVGIRRRHNKIIVEDFNDLDISNWAGVVKTGFSVHRIEGQYGGLFSNMAYTTLTSEIMLDDSEVEVFFRTPNVDVSYSVKFEIWDDPARIGAGSSAAVYNGSSNDLTADTVYKVIFRLRPSAKEYDVFIEKDNVRQVISTGSSGEFGSLQMKNSVIAIEGSTPFDVDPIIYQQKVNYPHEQIWYVSSSSYPCDDNLSEYEVVNLGSDAMNYSDNTDNISLSGFYAE